MTTGLSPFKEVRFGPSVDTTMIYTDQDALDLIRAYEREGTPIARDGGDGR